MKNKNSKVFGLIFLLLVNSYIIYDLADTIVSRSNIWVPIIMFLIEIVLIIVYRYAGQYGEKFGSVDHK